MMNKAELVKAVSEKAGLSQKAADAAVKAATETIIAALKKGEKVQLTGFGTFEVRKRAAREARNPRTGETLKLKAAKVPAFKAGATLKNAVK